MLACQHSLASAQQSAQRWRRKASDLVEDLEFDELELQLVRSFSRRGVGTRHASGAESLQSESCRGGSAAARPASSGRPVVVLQRADREGSAAHHLDPVRRRRGGERGEVRHPAFERRAAMQRAAIFASGTPIALLTNGTVRLARGFTSRTNTLRLDGELHVHETNHTELTSERDRLPADLGLGLSVERVGRERARAVAGVHPRTARCAP